MTAIDKMAIVEKVWDDGDKCKDCVFCRSYQQSHDEGPSESLRECEILDSNLDPWDCPGFEELYTEALAEEQEAREDTGQ